MKNDAQLDSLFVVLLLAGPLLRAQDLPSIGTLPLE